MKKMLEFERKMSSDSVVTWASRVSAAPHWVRVIEGPPDDVDRGLVKANFRGSCSCGKNAELRRFGPGRSLADRRTRDQALIDVLAMVRRTIPKCALCPFFSLTFRSPLVSSLAAASARGSRGV